MPVVSWSNKVATGGTAQTIPSDGKWHELNFGGGRIRVDMGEGRCLVVIWISGASPADTVRRPLLTALPAVPTTEELATVAGRKALNAWAQSVDRSVRALLAWSPPVWQFRVSRWRASGEDFTERQPVVMAAVRDWAGQYVAELDTDVGVPISISVRNQTGSPMTIDAMGAHFVPLAVRP